jgi:peptide deformylase
MAIREILTFPNPKLNEKSVDVEEVDDEIREIINDMVETMYDAPGIGLAAPQIGIHKNIIVVDVLENTDEDNPESEPKSGLVVLINPVISEKEGEICFEEGCLSVPDFLVKVKRPRDIVVCGLNKEGEEIELKCTGLKSVAIQHEMDHLKGILLTDHASHLKRSFYLKRLKKKEKAKKL